MSVGDADSILAAAQEKISTSHNNLASIPDTVETCRAAAAEALGHMQQIQSLLQTITTTYEGVTTQLKLADRNHTSARLDIQEEAGLDMEDHDAQLLFADITLAGGNIEKCTEIARKGEQNLLAIHETSPEQAVLKEKLTNFISALTVLLDEDHLSGAIAGTKFSAESIQFYRESHGLQ